KGSPPKANVPSPVALILTVGQGIANQLKSVIGQGHRDEPVARPNPAPSGPGKKADNSAEGAYRDLLTVLPKGVRLRFGDLLDDKIVRLLDPLQLRAYRKYVQSVSETNSARAAGLGYATVIARNEAQLFLYSSSENKLGSDANEALIAQRKILKPGSAGQKIN